VVGRFTLLDPTLAAACAAFVIGSAGPPRLRPSLGVVLLGMNLLWRVFLRPNGQVLELVTRDASPVALMGRPGGRGEPSCNVSIQRVGVFSSLAERDVGMQEADLALYAAKSAGRTRVEVFEPAVA